MRSHSVKKLFTATHAHNICCASFLICKNENECGIYDFDQSSTYTEIFFQNHRKHIHAPTIKMVEYMAVWQFWFASVAVSICRIQFSIGTMRLRCTSFCVFECARERTIERSSVLTFKMSLHPKSRTYKIFNFLLKWEWRIKTNSFMFFRLFHNQIDIIRLHSI